MSSKTPHTVGGGLGTFRAEARRRFTEQVQPARNAAAMHAVHAATAAKKGGDK